jgi:hypothetical protein
MKADDPKLRANLQELFERRQQINELILTVLQNHIVVEQFINEFLAVAGRSKRGTFQGKVDKCQLLNPPEIDAQIWQVLKAANELRNKIAHTFDQTKIYAKLAELRKAYHAALTPEQAKHAESLDDTKTAAGAFELCGAYIAAASDAAKQRKQKHN